MKYKAYTDGSYQESVGAGGCASVILDESNKVIKLICNGYKNTTNNRMEIQAVIEACKWAINMSITEITIVTDSMYVIGAMSKNWSKKKNSDLWEELDLLVEKLNITWTHVKGHSGDKYNELCDALAVEASHAKLN